MIYARLAPSTMVMEVVAVARRPCRRSGMEGGRGVDGPPCVRRSKSGARVALVGLARKRKPVCMHVYNGNVQKRHALTRSSWLMAGIV